jgi:hypothetical protein
MLEAEWDALVKPWRDEAERLGFRRLDGAVRSGDPRSTGVDFLYDGAGTFLDLSGFLAGRARAMTSAALHTWVDLPERTGLSTFGTMGSQLTLGGMVAKALAPLLKKLVPRDLRPVEIRSPADLAPLLERHREMLGRRGGKTVVFAPDPLEGRFEHVRREEADEAPAS